MAADANAAYTDVAEAENWIDGNVYPRLQPSTGNRPR